MAQHAPTCSKPGCSKPTWDASGKCYHHIAETRMEFDQVTARAHLGDLSQSSEIPWWAAETANRIDVDNLADGINRVAMFAHDSKELTEEEKRTTLYMTKTGAYKRMTPNGSYATANERGEFIEDPNEVDRKEAKEEAEFQHIMNLPAQQRYDMAKAKIEQGFNDPWPEELEARGDTAKTRQAKRKLKMEREDAHRFMMDNLDELMRRDPDRLYPGPKDDNDPYPQMIGNGKRKGGSMASVRSAQTKAREAERDQKKGLRRISYMMRGGSMPTK